MIPRFRQHVRAIVIDPEHVALLGEGPHECIAGRLHPLLVPLIDGRRSVDEISAALHGRALLADVLFGLSILEEGEWITSEPRRSVQTLSRLMLDTLQGHPRVHAEGVALQPLTDYLNGTAPDPSIATGGIWLPFKPDPDSPWIGPLVAPPRTPCWSCVTARLVANQPWRALPGMAGSAVEPADMPTSGDTRDLRVIAAVVELLDRCDWSDLEDSLFVWDAGTRDWGRHRIARAPTCPRCGRLPEESPSRQETFWQDGGWRIAPPEVTLARLMPHLSPVTGVISTIESVGADGDGTPPVVVAEYLFPVAHTHDALVRTGGRRRSAGKGLTASQARVSAICEAVERYSGVFRGDEPRVRAAHLDLGDAAVHPNALLQFSAAQFAGRERWNAGAHERVRVPIAFDETWSIEWTPARAVATGDVLYIPTACAYFGYALPPEQAFATADSNGCAAGNTIDEAILQGALELIERDAAALWWYTRASRPAVDLDTFEARLCERTAAHRRLGRSLVVLDLTTDVDIPVLVAISRSAASGHDDLAIGFGAHFDPAIALARALTEVDQWLAALAAGVAAPRVSRDPGQAPYLHPSTETPRTRADLSRDGLMSIEEAVLAVSTRLSACGITLLAIDQTRAELGFPVVRTVAPGLRHFWPRFGPGRLYSVPTLLGWIERPVDEADLNPCALLV